MAEWISVSVAAATRAAKVDAFQFVIGVKDERHVERARGEAARPLAREHVEKIRRMIEGWIRLNRATAGAQSPECRDDRSDLRRQPYGFAIVGLDGVVGRVRIVVGRVPTSAFGVHPSGYPTAVSA